MAKCGLSSNLNRVKGESCTVKPQAHSLIPVRDRSEASARHHWQNRQSAADYQLTITASTLSVLSVGPLVSESFGPLPT